MTIDANPTAAWAAARPDGAGAPPYSCILFDLDGTIIDSAPGITGALVEMFTELGRPVPPAAELLRFVGPPILDSFQSITGMTEAQARAALVVYRRIYDGALALRSEVFDGVRGLLDDLVAAGLPLALATGKPRRSATAILEHRGLADRFVALCGASDDETVSAKSEIVGLALAALREAGVDVSRPVMIGDRDIDVDGAAAHGVPTIVVGWGYGTAAEAENAITTAADVDALRRLLLGR